MQLLLVGGEENVIFLTAIGQSNCPAWRVVGVRFAARCEMLNFHKNECIYTMIDVELVPQFQGYSHLNFHTDRWMKNNCKSEDI